MDYPIKIELSKPKIILLLIGAVGFVILGILLAVRPQYFESPLFQNYQVLRIIGIISVAFFGTCLVFISRKLLDKRIGLTIDQEGIIDHSNATSVGLIEWDDITNVKTVQIASTRILMLETNNPTKYIERAKNQISKNAMKTNNKLYGSPLSIISSSLRIKFEDLEKLIKTELERRNN